jgi:hypothetical protein
MVFKEQTEMGNGSVSRGRWVEKYPAFFAETKYSS